MGNYSRRAEKTGRRGGSINRVTRYDIFIINHNASAHDPSGVFEEYCTREEREREEEGERVKERERERAAEALLLFSNS